ncbi:MAG: yjjG [Clostridia bacterium]|nr:yjjG [Clostridia bacterium]
MTLPKAILFDLDDTILSFDNASELALKKCCDDFISVNNVTFDSDMLQNKFKETRNWYWSDSKRNIIGRENMLNARCEVFQYTLEKLNFFDEAKIYEIADTYSNLQESFWSLFDDTAEALDIIKSLKIRMTIVTNGASQTQRGKLERFNLNDYFEQVIIDTEVGYSKPDIRIYEIALEKMALSPKEVWMTGDNIIWDVEAPQKLGIYSIWNDFKKKGLSENQIIIPDKIVFSVYELSQELLNIYFD